MSLLGVATRLRATAAALRSTEALLRTSGEMVVAETRSNFDKSQVAGEFRPAIDTSGAPAGGAMTPLSQYTLDKRNKKGVFHPDPLKDTGQMRAGIGIRKSTATEVTVGGTDTRTRMLLKKHLGSDISLIGSTDLDRPIPYRSPFGYTRQLLARVLSLWDASLGVGDNTNGSVDIEVRL